MPDPKQTQDKNRQQQGGVEKKDDQGQHGHDMPRPGPQGGQNQGQEKRDDGGRFADDKDENRRW